MDQRGPLPPHGKQAGLGLVQILIENEKPERPAEPQFWRETAQADGALMGARKNGLAIAWLAHEKSRQHEACAGYRFERAEVGTVVLRCLPETLQGAFKPDPRVLVPETPPSP